MDGVVGITLQRGASVKPGGDVTSVEIVNRSLPQLMQMLDRQGIGRDEGTSISSSQPLSIISPSGNKKIVTDNSEAIWEEAEQILVRESDATWNTILLMGLAGFLAAIGIATNSIHLVVGAMVVAPGFQPLMRIPLGLIVCNRSWLTGIHMSAKLYGSLLVGAALAALLMLVLGTDPRGGKASYVEGYELMQYWRTITPSTFAVSLAAGIAGALLIATQRSVLTSGVMIALALIPSLALVSIGLVTLDWWLAFEGFLRWLIDVVLVIAAGAGVFAFKRKRVHKRSIMPENG